MTSQKLGKKGIATNHKNPSVSKPYCSDCQYGIIHSTGSLIWVSCRFQSGWRSVSSQCNLPDEELRKLTKRRLKK